MIGGPKYDATRTPTMRRNSIALGAFIADCKARGLKVTVGLSSSTCKELNEPPNDLVIYVQSTDVSRPLRLAERVSGPMRETLTLMRRQIGMVAQ